MAGSGLGTWLMENGSIINPYYGPTVLERHDLKRIDDIIAGTTRIEFKTQDNGYEIVVQMYTHEILFHQYFKADEKACRHPLTLPVNPTRILQVQSWINKHFPEPDEAI